MKTTIEIELTKMLQLSALASALVDTLDKIPMCAHYEKEAETAVGLADLLADLLNAAMMEGVA